MIQVGSKVTVNFGDTTSDMSFAQYTDITPEDVGTVDRIDQRRQSGLARGQWSYHVSFERDPDGFWFDVHELIEVQA